MKKRPSITLILLLLCLLPAVLSISVNIFTSFKYIKSTTENEIETMLKATGYSMMETLNSLDSGTYRLSGDILFKGGTNLSNSLDIIDAMKEKTNVEYTLFYGDTRYMTTVMDETGNRVLLTQCSDAVKEIVLG